MKNKAAAMLYAKLISEDISMQDFAKLVGVSPSMISCVCRGAAPLPLPLAAKIGKKLGKEFGLGLINMQSQERLERDVRLYNKLTKGSK